MPPPPANDLPDRLPEWIARERIRLGGLHSMKVKLRTSGLRTVCEEARCPNCSKCFGRGVATFLLLGDTCTRNCAFCAIRHGMPAPPDPKEPWTVAEETASLGLDYVVLTSVSRDDLPDGGAEHFAQAVQSIHGRCPGVGVEVLTPDFQGSREALERVLETNPTVFNHNLETVPRLYPEVRPMADYRRSLEVLRRAGGVPTKSGLMLGLGERREELDRVFDDLLAAGVGCLTMGQYLRPSRQQLPVYRYVHPDEFEAMGERARAMGFQRVRSGPLVRSSLEANSTYSW